MDVDGTRYRVDVGSADKKIAELWLRRAEELLAQARLGIIPKVGRIDRQTVAGIKKEDEKEPVLTLKEFSEKYERLCRDDLELAPKTRQLNSLALKSLISCVGNKKLDAITHEEIVDWKQDLAQKKRSRTTIAIYFRHLRAAFNNAVKWEMVESNPFLLVVEPKEKGRSKKTRDKDMSYAEVRKLLKAIEDVADHQFGHYLRFLLYTGCRRNEILSLRWEDVDLEGRKLSIYAEKSKKDMEIPINKALLGVIQEMKVKKEGYVFPTQSTGRGVKKGDRPWSKDFVTHHFKAYIRTLGLSEDYTLHSLRHTYTTYLRQKGVPLDIIYRLLGHSSPAVTREHYDHSIALHFREQADLVDFEGDEENDETEGTA